METLQLVLLLVLAGAIWARRRMYTFPGRWRFAFEKQYAEERQLPKEARSKVRELEHARNAQRSEAQRGVDTAEREHRQRISSWERQLTELRSPGGGPSLRILSARGRYTSTRCGRAPTGYL